MEMMQSQMAMNSASTTQEKGCYTVDELMDILCVGRKAIYSLIHKKASLRFESAAWATGSLRPAFMPG